QSSRMEIIAWAFVTVQASGGVMVETQPSGRSRNGLFMNVGEVHVSSSLAFAHEQGEAALLTARRFRHRELVQLLKCVGANDKLKELAAAERIVCVGHIKRVRAHCYSYRRAITFHRTHSRRPFVWPLANIIPS